MGFCLFKMPFFDFGRPLVDSLNLISLEHSSASPPCSQWRALRFSSPPLSSPLPAAAPSDLSSLSLSLESSSSLLSESKTFVILYMYKKALIATFDTNYLTTQKPLWINNMHTFKFKRLFYSKKTRFIRWFQRFKINKK